MVRNPFDFTRVRRSQRSACSGPARFRRFQGLVGALLLALGGQSALWAGEANATICCRASGGTRGLCLSQWLQLVPSSNRFDPGSQRLIALIQGNASQPTSLVVQFTSASGAALGEQTLPPREVGIRLLSLPPEQQLSLSQPLIWETYPTCQPNKPPTRSILAADPSPEQRPAQNALAGLSRSCGQLIDSHALLRLFDLEGVIAGLPQRLLVSCEALTLGPVPSGHGGMQ